MQNNKLYCFEWKKKNYSFLKGLEKYVANYYQANRDNDIQFLYPYERIDKNVVGKVDNDPWAIMIDNQRHSILWTEATLRDASYSQIDRFAIVEPKDQNKLINILIDENNQILAKSINGVISYKDNL